MQERKFDSKAAIEPTLSRQPAEGQGGQVDHPLLQLQQQYGNRYVQRVLALSRESEGEAEATPDVEAAIQQARGGEQALDSGVRAQMEPAFGADFSGVRVHADAGADDLNRSLNARAFTTGQDIFFRQGAYSPGSSSGRELLAHELTHVVQQNGDEVRTKLTLSQPGDRYEQEADRVARAIMQPEQEPVQRKTDAGLVQRQIEEEEEEQEGPVQTRAEDGWVQQSDQIQRQMLAFARQNQAVAQDRPRATDTCPITVQTSNGTAAEAKTSGGSGGGFVVSLAHAAKFNGKVLSDDKGWKTYKGQCAAGVQYVFYKAGNQLGKTSTWKQGVKVKGNNVSPGTAIASFKNGKFANDHAAIFIQETKSGLEVWDQYNTPPKPWGKRWLRFDYKGKSPYSNDGDYFYVITK